MANLLTRLKSLQKPIRTGIIGIGNIGKGILYQTTVTPGIQCLAVADLEMERLLQWVEELGLDYSIAETPGEIHQAVQHGQLAVCPDGMLLAAFDGLDVLVDSSNAIPEGLRFAETAISQGKHMVMMNSEADLIFGPYLLELAQKQGVVYTSADGDQHTVIMRMINEIELWGFKTVMAGNIKGYLDRYANPVSIVPEAQKRYMDERMCTSYTDGTKLNIEMALVANAIGAKTAQPGMYGPPVKSITDIFQVFDFPSLWDGCIPLVDYTFGTQPSGGVFVVGYNDHPHQMQTLGWYPCYLGQGPFYVFHRPFHLGHFEAMTGIAEAALDGWGVLYPEYGYRTLVYAYAKKDLKKDELLDGIGGFSVYGLIENCDDNAQSPGLPICLAENVRLMRDVPKDQKILLEDIHCDAGEPRFRVFTSTSRAGESF